MVDDEMLIVAALKGHVRVNTTLKTVEIYDDYGVKMVLKDLDEMTYEAFKDKYPNYQANSKSGPRQEDGGLNQI